MYFDVILPIIQAMLKDCCSIVVYSGSHSVNHNEHVTVMSQSTDVAVAIVLINCYCCWSVYRTVVAEEGGHSFLWSSLYFCILHTAYEDTGVPHCPTRCLTHLKTFGIKFGTRTVWVALIRLTGPSCGFLVHYLEHLSWHHMLTNVLILSVSLSNVMFM